MLDCATGVILTLGFVGYSKITYFIRNSVSAATIPGRGSQRCSSLQITSLTELLCNARTMVVTALNLNDPGQAMNATCFSAKSVYFP